MIPFQFVSDPISAGEGTTVPAGITTKAELFDFLSSALSFPRYFGRNWDALEECLQDIGCSSPLKTTLFHEDIPLANDIHGQRVYLEILADVARRSVNFKVVFLGMFRSQIERVLSPNGAT